MTACPSLGWSAEAEDLSGFSVVLQRGDTSHPDAIEISPDGRWFLTASATAIYLSDVESGTVFRAIIPPVRIGRVAISRDGTNIFAQTAPYQEPEQIFGWKAETGAPMSNAQAEAPAMDDANWSWLEKLWPGKNGPPENVDAPKTYLTDHNIAQLVDVDRVVRVEPTNRENVVQVTVAGEPDERDEAFDPHHYYFIDLVQQRVVADVSGKTLKRSCGEPHGAFAFNGRYLIVAPTELDASSSFVNSMVIDAEAKPPALKWSRACQDWQVSSIGMTSGLIVVDPEPDKERIWDSETARPLAVLDDIYEVVNWSRDHRTFASGFRDAGNPAQPDKFGVSLLRFGKKLFIPTDQEVKEIRLNPDGSVVFAKTDAGWDAWATSDGKPVPADLLPPFETDFQAPDSREVTSPDGKFRIVDESELVDVASGRVLVKAYQLRLTYDSRFVWAPSDVSSITVWDAASGHQMWTATANDQAGEDFLFMQFPDGRVRLSPSAEKLVKLVRGFQVRPFDDAARQVFVRP